MLIKQLLDQRGRSVISVTPESSVYAAIALMAERSIGALVVLDGARLVGVLSERDYARKVILQDRSSKTTQVREIMTTRVITGRENQTIGEGLTLMTERRIRHLPILRDDELRGLVSFGDLVQATIADQRFVIEQLESYIAS
jgi:CBS domain-containing protein